MDIKWLEDYLALVEYGSFTKAAESRFVTQPAFSRRIKSLESWLGVDLVDRSFYPLKLTKTAIKFTPELRDILEDFTRLQHKIQKYGAHGEHVTISTQHSLSVSFCPKFLCLLEPFLHKRSIRFNASNLHECLNLFLSGHTDFLLCYYLPDIYPELERPDLVRLDFGKDEFIPVTRAPLALPAGDGVVLLPHYDYIGYPLETFFGGLVQEQCLPQCSDGTELNLVCETALASSIKAMVLQGHGVGWLPFSLVENEIEQKSLVRIPQLPSLELSINFYGHEPPNSKLAKAFWKVVSQTDGH